MSINPGFTVFPNIHTLNHIDLQQFRYRHSGLCTALLHFYRIVQREKLKVFPHYTNEIERKSHDFTDKMVSLKPALKVNPGQKNLSKGFDLNFRKDKLLRSSVVPL